MLKGKLSSEIVNERQQYINSLKRYVSEKKEKLQQVLGHLKVTEDSLKEVEAKQVCPFDKNHSVPEHAFKRHVEKCRLLQGGLQEDELPSQLQDLDFGYKDTQVMKIPIDESLLNKIIWDECAQTGQVYTGHRTMPRSYIDEAVNLTQSDRLAIYNYVKRVSHEAGKVIPVDQTDHLLTTDWGQLVKKGMLSEQNNQQYSSKLEQLAALRDMKRRRQSYRAKNVHITKKSYTEIIREVIVNQMEILTPEKEETRKDFPEEEKDSDRGRRRGHGDLDDSSSSRDKDRNRDREKDDYRSRDRNRSRERDDYRSRDRNKERDRDKNDHIDRNRRRRSRERSREKSKERNWEGDRGEKRSKEEGILDDEVANQYAISDRLSHDRLRDKLESEDVKRESESPKPLEKDKDVLSRKRRQSESSFGSDEDDYRRHRSKQKKSKSKHKKKHKSSKKHKK